jgi:hypothetical protein
MNKITSSEELDAVIVQLEHSYYIQKQSLKEQFRLSYDSLKPVNIIKNTIRETISSPEIKDDIIEYFGNLVADYVTKQFTKGSSDNFVKKYLGQVLHYGIRTIIKLNSEAIRSLGDSFADILWGDHENRNYKN